jgi:hypothetical protein
MLWGGKKKIRIPKPPYKIIFSSEKFLRHFLYLCNPPDMVHCYPAKHLHGISERTRALQNYTFQPFNVNMVEKGADNGTLTKNTGYRMEDRSSIQGFSLRDHVRIWNPLSLLTNWYRVIFPRGNAAGTWRYFTQPSLHGVVIKYI